MPFLLSEEKDNNILYRISYFNLFDSLLKISLIYLKSHLIKKEHNNNLIKIVRHLEVISIVKKTSYRPFQDKYKP